MIPYSDAKLAHDRELRAERKAERDAKRPYRKCFWTVPFGHRWRVLPGGGMVRYYECVACGKRKEVVLFG